MWLIRPSEKVINADPEIVSKGDQRGNVRLSQAVFIKRYGASGRAENVSKLFLIDIAGAAKIADTFCKCWHLQTVSPAE